MFLLNKMNVLTNKDGVALRDCALPLCFCEDSVVANYQMKDVCNRTT